MTTKTDFRKAVQSHYSVALCQSNDPEAEFHLGSDRCQIEMMQGA
jgi:hypothetical protein